MRSMNALRGSGHFQRGVTLVEALVALLVLSIGLLGVAGLQMAALRNNHGAHLRSQATVLAYDILDRMRANRTAAMATSYNVTLTGTLSGATLAAQDVQTWKQTLLDALPAGAGSINLVNPTPTTNLVTIRVEWTDKFGTEFFETMTQI